MSGQKKGQSNVAAALKAEIEDSVAFDEDDYQTLRERYLEHHVRTNVELPSGRVLSRQTQPPVIETNSPGYKALRKEIGRLEQQHDGHLGIFSLLRKLANFEKNHKAPSPVVPGTEEADPEVVTDTDQNPEVMDVDTFITEVLLVEPALSGSHAQPNSTSKSKNSKRKAASSPDHDSHDDKRTDQKKKTDIDKSDETIQLPAGDLTRHRMDEFFDSTKWTDRQRVCWALQTEARVRLAKLEQREGKKKGDGSRSPGSAYNDTLESSDYLFDLYQPSPPKETSRLSNSPGARLVRKDTESNDRKLHPAFDTSVRPPDSTFASVTELDMSRYNRMDSNFFCKHTWDGINGLSPYPTYPRCAIMGGAVVAALSAWRDVNIRSMFEEARLNELLGACSGGTEQNDCEDWYEQYEQSKKSLLENLNRYFLYQGRLPNGSLVGIPRRTSHPSDFPMDEFGRDDSPSCFATGDVDIFLQASPFAKALTNHLMSECSMDALITNRIQSFVHQKGFHLLGLEKVANDVYGEENLENMPSDSQFVFAVSRNALNAILTWENDESYSQRPRDRRTYQDGGDSDGMWPRPLQMIMLDEQADMVGGLMDFDISTCCCAFDGLNVKVTPRAAFSLMTTTQIVTPFVLEEGHRSFKRIVKYYRRGFDPYVIDPNCTDGEQSWHQDQNESMTGPDGIIPNDQARPVRARQKGQYRHVIQYQEENGKTTCCGCAKHSQIGERFFGAQSYQYSFSLFEEEQGDAFAFFKRRNNWTNEFTLEVESVNPFQRMACRECRYDYEDYRFLKLRPDYSPETLDEILSGDKTLKRQEGRSIFARSFYSGGVFDSRRWGRSALNQSSALSSLQSQLKAEEARYRIKHEGSLEGYAPRFERGTLEGSENKPWRGWGERLAIVRCEKEFSGSSRAPVGLNPERFIASCKACSQWLVNYKYGVEYCNDCQDTKPAAL